jgi:diguanylate cyclase (GGDEF)-like protein/PAS domain S-box-containing protein
MNEHAIFATENNPQLDGKARQAERKPPPVAPDQHRAQGASGSLSISPSPQATFYEEKKGLLRLNAAMVSGFDSGREKTFLAQKTHSLSSGFLLPNRARRTAKSFLSAKKNELLCSEPFIALAEDSPDVIVRYDLECRRLYVNKAFSKLAGKTKEELLGKRITPYELAPDADLLHEALLLVIANGEGSSFEYSRKTLDGRQFSCECRLIPEFDSKGKVLSILGVGRNISEHREYELRLNRIESLAKIGHWHWCTNHKNMHVSVEACRIFERPTDWKPAPDDVLAMLVDEDRKHILDALTDACRRKALEFSFSCRLQRSASTTHIHASTQLEYNQDGGLCRLSGTVRDLSELKNYESRLYELAHYDSLTGLPNRALFKDRLNQSLTDAARHGHVLGLIILSPLGFGAVNDSHGHDTGDCLLQAFAQRMKNLTGGHDSVARIGGDEFAISLPDIRNTASLGEMARKIMAALATPFRIDNEDLFAPFCMGIAAFPLDGSTASELIQHADSARHDAKTRGRSGLRFYSSELTVKSKHRTKLEAALRVAETKNELDLYFQPKIDLTDGRMVGAEALLRWNHPTLGLVPPDEFIGIAEETGLIVGMGAWVLAKACLTARHWNQLGGRELKVAINLSSRQFHDDDLLTTVHSILSLTNCKPHWLEFEITESLLLKDDNSVRSTLQAFRQMGISLAIDDFGTGYSSLAYLKRFPIDVLKIDRSFINDLTRDADSTELVKAIISMARSMRLGLVAEGIETKGQEQFLQACGCQFGQGFLYSKPLPRSEFEARFLLSENTGKTG